MKIAGVIAAAFAGMLVPLAVPTTFGAATDLVVTVLRYEQRHVQNGGSAANLVFDARARKPAGPASRLPLKLDLGQSFDPQIQFGIQRTEEKTQGIRADIPQSAQWTGAPPN